MANVFIEGLPPNPNATRGQHWSKIYKSQQEWKMMTGLLAKQVYRDPLDKAHLHFHISVGDNRPRDMDNIIASLKPALDGLKGVWIKDDNIDCISLEYSVDREKPRGFRIELKESLAQ